MLTDDPFDPTAAADTRRETAATIQRTWRGKPLLWTFSREARFEFIRLKAPPLSPAQDAALQHRASLTPGSPEHQAATVEAMRLLGGRSTPRLANAILALWLMLHEPEDWNAHPEPAALRSLIDRWSDAQLTTATPDEVIEILTLVDATIEDAETTRAIPRPASHPAGEHEAGNSPSP
jgi:hypothetical protein